MRRKAAGPCPFAYLTSFLQTFDGRLTTFVPRRRKLQTMKTTFLPIVFLVSAAAQASALAASAAQENYVAGTFPRRAAGARLLSGRPPANREIVVQVQ